MLRIGCHLSFAKGYLRMGKEAVSIGANTFQFFMRNPRGGRAKEISDADVKAYHAFAKKHDIDHILVHAPYTLNACSAAPHLRAFAQQMMADDLRRMEYIPGNCYNFHPGSHVKQGTKAGIDYIVQMLNNVLTPDMRTTVLLETMSGKGSEIGKDFEELRAIIDGVERKEKLGICIDTCHLWDSGYDIVNDLDGVLEHFDAVIGLSRLYAIHLNDSLNPIGSRKDRHARIGAGMIGLDALIRVINHPLLESLPFYLETPNDLAGYAKEIHLLRTCSVFDSNVEIEGV